MPEQVKLSKEDHDKLEKAVAAYARVTGENFASILGKIPVGETEEDKEAAAKKRDDAYAKQAELNARVEETQQAERQARNAAVTPDDDVQPGNPGGGQPAMATEKAKAAGHDRKGEEPSTARGR